MRRRKSYFTIRNFLWRLKLRLVIKALKLWTYRFDISKKGLLTLACVFVFSGVVLGYAWRMGQVDEQYRQDALYLIRHINDTHREIKALRIRLADAEARMGQRVARKR